MTARSRHRSPWPYPRQLRVIQNGAVEQCTVSFRVSKSVYASTLLNDVDEEQGQSRRGSRRGLSDTSERQATNFVIPRNGRRRGHIASPAIAIEQKRLRVARLLQRQGPGG